MADHESPIHALAHLVRNINYKIALLLFVCCIVVFSDIFIDGVLSTIDGATIHGNCITTSKGILIQSSIIATSYVIIDLLSQGKLI